MLREQGDQALAGLRSAHGRIAAAMFALDGHPGLGFLRAGGNRGQTAALWDRLGSDIDVLWTEFNQLTAVLDSLAQANPRKLSEAETTTLERGLAIAGPLEAHCADAGARLDELNVAWTACGAAVVPVTDAVTAVERLGTGLGDPAAATSLSQRAAALRDSLLGDPLTAAPAGTLTTAVQAELAALTADARAMSQRLSAQAEVRDGFGEQVRRLERDIEAVRAEEARTAQAFARAVAKIADPGLPPTPAAAAILAARVGGLNRLYRDQQWPRLADDVAALRAAVTQAHDRAIELRDAADGLLARRDELRGRLEAYRSKAARHQIDEDAELATLHTSAHTLLYTAPCDLPEATRAVFAYQKHVAAMATGPSPRAGRKDVR